MEIHRQDIQTHLNLPSTAKITIENLSVPTVLNQIELF